MNADFSFCELTPDEFEPLVLGDDGVVVVYFRSSICLSSQSLDAIMEVARQKLSPEVNFWLVNVDQNPASASRFSVNTIPTLLIFKNGCVAERIVNPSGETDLVKKIKEWILDQVSLPPHTPQSLDTPPPLMTWSHSNSLPLQ